MLSSGRDDTKNETHEASAVDRNGLRWCLALLFSAAISFFLYHKDHFISAQYAALLSLLLVVVSYGFATRQGDDAPYFRCGTVGVLLALVLTCLPLAGYTWSMADDYVIPMMLGPSGRMGLGDLARRLASTESLSVIFDNASGRFQPVFVLMYALDAFFFGDSITAWYVWYGCLFLASAALLLLALRQCFDGITAVLAGCVLLTQLQWHWLFRDTGVVEVYGLFGLALVLYRIARDFDRPSVSLGSYALLALGNLVMLGTKETFVLACALPLVFLLARCRRGPAGQRRRALVFFGLILLCDLYVFLGIWAALSVTGADVYGREVGVASLCTSLGEYLSALGGLIRWPWYAAALAALVAVRLFLGRERESRTAFRTRTLGYGLATAWVFLFGLSQYVFYHGEVDNQHYSLPFSATPAVLWLLAGRYFLETTALAPARTARTAAGMLVGFLCAYGFLTAPLFARDFIRIFGQSNAAYVATLEKIAAAVSGAPDRPLVLVVGDTDNDELVVSPAVYLKKVLRIPNAIFVKQAAAETPLIRRLRDEGYVDVLLPGEPPSGAPAFLVGVMAVPEGEFGNLGRLLPVEAGQPRLKLFPVLSRNIW